MTKLKKSIKYVEIHIRLDTCLQLRLVAIISINILFHVVLVLFHTHLLPLTSI